MLVPCSNHYSLCTLLDAYKFATAGQDDSFYKVGIEYLGRQGGGLEYFNDTAMPIRSPKGDLGPLGDFWVKIGPLLVPFYTKSPFPSLQYSIIWLNWWGFVFFLEIFRQIYAETQSLSLSV